MNAKKNVPEETKEILIVEDSPTQAEQLKYLLEQYGYTVLAASSGKQALALLDKHKPLLVVSDIVMPEMDGYELCRQIKSAKVRQDIPVILLTSLSDAEDVLNGLECGADNFITKPYNEEYLLSHVEQIIASRKLLKNERVRVGIEIMFGGKRRFVTADQQQMLSLLISTYEEAVRKNADLVKTQNMYKLLNERLEDMVEERTAALTNEVAERKQLEAEATILARFPSENPNPVLRIDKNGALLFANEASTCLFTGWGCKDKSVVPDILKKFCRSASEKNLREIHEVACSEWIYSLDIVPFAGSNYVNIYGNDITERKQAEEKQKKLEEQLRQSQKLEAIGQLSSGVAHDFNNLLGGIMGHAELLKMHLSEGSDLLRHTTSIISSCVKAADLTKQLLTFARKAPVELQKIDMNTFIKQVVGLMERTIDRRIEIAVNVQKEPAFISGDRNQLENAFLNIAINARDAMPEGGRLSITSETVDLDEDALANEHFKVVKGPYIRIIVEDTGTGMSKAIKDRIFEPFFTTKEVGKGTGLGLASVYGCVKQHNGYITVDSHLGIGTQFNIYLPEIKSTNKIDGKKEDATLVSGKGALLVVDDEPVFSEVLKEIFGGIGYTVHCCANGAEAVAFYNERNSEIQVVILDMNMPKMNGLHCFRRLKEINANVKVIVSTGYGDNKDRATMQNEGVRTFVQKPYRAAELAKKIAELIGP